MLGAQPETTENIPVTGGVYPLSNTSETEASLGSDGECDLPDNMVTSDSDWNDFQGKATIPITRITSSKKGEKEYT